MIIYSFIFIFSGRKITSKGQKDLDQIAGQVRSDCESDPLFSFELVMTRTMLMQSFK